MATPRPQMDGIIERWERAWLGLGARRHLSALAVLALVALVLYLGALLQPGPQGDEGLYAEAAARAAAGESPFSVPGYYYPAAFAHVWAATEKLSPFVPARVIWRLANLAGAVLLVWLAAIHLPDAGRRWRRNAVLCALLLPLPGLWFALHTGNLSVLTAFLVASGVLLAGRRWIVAGLLLGLSAGLKPLAVPALVALVVPSRGGRRSQDTDAPGGPSRSIAFGVVGPEQRAGGLGLAIAAGILLAFPHSIELLGQQVQPLTSVRTASFVRLFELLGLSLPRLLVIALVYGSLALCAWIGTRSRVERATVALAGAMVAAPLVWSHTLLLGLPMLTAALALHAPALVGSERSVRERLVALATFALVALQLFFQPGGFDHQPRWAQLVLMTPMLAAPPLTAALVIHRSRRSAREDDLAAR